jgi:mono/diheme cytochrome c family protein
MNEPDKLRTVPEDPPSAGRDPAPVALLVALILLLLWGMSYLDGHGGVQAMVYAPYRSLKEVRDDQPRSEVGDKFAKGKEVYGRTCVLCHQPTGLGEANKAPPLAGSEWVLAQNPNRIIRVVLHGFTGPVTVKREEWNLSMVAWNGVLTPDEIANVLTYARQEWGNNASEVKVEQVKAIMEKEKDRLDNWTAEQLLKIPETE